MKVVCVHVEVFQSTTETDHDQCRNVTEYTSTAPQYKFEVLVLEYFLITPEAPTSLFHTCKRYEEEMNPTNCNLCFLCLINNLPQILNKLFCASEAVCTVQVFASNKTLLLWFGLPFT